MYTTEFVARFRIKDRPHEQLPCFCWQRGQQALKCDNWNWTSKVDKRIYSNIFSCHELISDSIITHDRRYKSFANDLSTFSHGY
jgi:hypothetical protein